MKKKFLLWFIETSLYRKIILGIMPFIRFSTYYTKFRGHLYHQGYFYLKPGMMIGTIDYAKATGMIIPKVTGGILSHVGFCVGKRDPKVPDQEYARIQPMPGQGDGLEIVEMTHLNFTFSDFFDMCKESDRVIIFDCDDWDELYKKRVIEAALSMKLAKYDAAFSLGIKSLYCSELIYQSDKIAGNGNGRLKCDIGDLMGLGRPYISPDGLLCSDNITVVWDSKNELNGLKGSQIKDIIFKK
jgi:hypothetical protein